MSQGSKTFQAITDSAPEPIRIVGRVKPNEKFQFLHEGKWVDGRYDGNIRVDRNTHFASVGADDVHAHVYGRRDRDDALVAVHLDGSKSHGLGGRLHRDDAAALRALGFKIRDDNVVETLLVSRAGAFFLSEAVEAGFTV